MDKKTILLFKMPKISKVPVFTFVAFYKAIFNCIALLAASSICLVTPKELDDYLKAVKLLNCYCKLSICDLALETSALNYKFTWIVLFAIIYSPFSHYIEKIPS